MIESLFPLGISPYVVGGIFVGLGIGIPFILTGLVAGVSTVFTSTWSYIHSGKFFQREGFVQTRSWRIALILGLFTGGLVFLLSVAGGVPAVTDIHPVRLFIGGIIIGIGTRMSGGCTSGHGICGIAAFETVSVVATLTFLSVAIVVAHLTAYLF